MITPKIEDNTKKKVSSDLLPRTFYGTSINNGFEPGTVVVFTMKMKYVGDIPLIYNKCTPEPSMNPIPGIDYLGPYKLTETERIIFMPNKEYEFFVEETIYNTSVERKFYINIGSPLYLEVNDGLLVYFKAIPTKDPESDKIVDIINHLYPNENDNIAVNK